MKKRYLLLFLLATIVSITACTKSEEKEQVEIESEASFYGKITEVNKEDILVKVYDEDGKPEEGNILYVSKDVQLKESDQDFNIGDEVTVYYNGMVARSYPGQVNGVYAIIIEKKAESNKK